VTSYSRMPMEALFELGDAPPQFLILSKACLKQEDPLWKNISNHNESKALGYTSRVVLLR